MARDSTDDDRGKSVVDDEGNRLGNVTDIQNGNGIIETDDNSSLTDKLKSALSWDDSDDTHELRSDDVGSINDNEVRLRNP